MPVFLDNLLTAQLFVSVHVIIIVVHVILVTVAYSTYAERKISAWIHDRIGPNRVGPIGLLQPLADGVKLMFKEDYAPRGVDKALFTLAPIAIIIPALIGWAIIPWGGYWDLPTIPLPFGMGTIEGAQVLVAGADINVGVIYLMAIASLGVYGVTLGGWSSNNKYSFFGGLRASAGMISYEIPMGLALLCVLLLAGTVSPMGIIGHQIDHGWMVLSQPLVCLLFYICVLAESNRAPFDNAEAEQELVGGYHTEYSSQRFALFFLAEYAHIVTGSAFFVLLFFGGFHIPFVTLTHVESTGLLAMLTKFAVFYGKTLFIIFLTMWVRWTIPRIRWDQVMKLAWNGLIPIGIAALIMTSVLHYLEWTSLLATLLANVLLAFCVIVLQRALPRAKMNRRVELAGSRFNPLEQGSDGMSQAPSSATGQRSQQLVTTR
ncbi:MAG: NADH-quinone oxidoreductase subunit NuoH [Phycisphaerales bacterium JB043]